jgi:hypothetical protein
MREVDVSLRAEIGLSKLLIIIECRDRGAGPEDVRWIEELATKRRDVHADKAIAVASGGFTEGARNTADHEGILLRELRQIDVPEISTWFGEPIGVEVETRMVDIRGVSFIGASDEPDSPSTSAGIPEVVSQGKSEPDEPMFRTPDGMVVSMNTLWKNVARDELYAGGRRVNRNVQLRFSDGERWRLIIDDAAGLEIEAVEIDCDVWIERRHIPVERWYEYRSTEGVLGEVAEVLFDWAGQRATLKLHRSPTRIGATASRQAPN